MLSLFNMHLDEDTLVVHVTVPRQSTEEEATPEGDVVPGTEDGDGPSESPEGDN